MSRRMTSINNRNRRAYSVNKAIAETGIHRHVFFDTASILNVQLLIRPPDNVEVYLVGSHHDEPPKSYSKFNNENSPPISLAQKKIEFLCLSPSEYETALRIEGHRQRKFYAVTIVSGDGEYIENIFPATCIEEMHKIPYALGFFITAKPNTGSETYPQNNVKSREKSIHIDTNELFILENDRQALMEEIKINEKALDYGKFVPSDWTSPKLRQLNEASTLFFSEKNLAGKHPDEIEISEIRNWLKLHWGPKSGADLIEQAINAVLPDHLYSNSPPKNRVTDEQRKNYNNYTSTTLVIINEMAKKYWQEMTDKYKNCGREKYPTRFKIKNELTEARGPWRLTARLAAAVATIIKPEGDDRTKKTKASL